MTDAREAMLARIRSAIADRPVPPQVVRAYDRSGPAGIDPIALFAQRVGDYRATVEVVDPAALPAAIAAALSSRAVTTLAVPSDAPPGWLSALDPAVAVEVDRFAGRADDPRSQELVRHAGVGRQDQATGVRTDAITGAAAGLSHARLDEIGAVLTGAAVGIALTGTIVLDAGAAQGRRALTLLPDVHVCVIRADQIVTTVAQALERLDPTRPLTWISGPSATSDIELNRVEGVHGPRTLHVIIAC